MWKFIAVLLTVIFTASAGFCAVTTVNDAIEVARGFLTLDTTPFREYISHSLESVETHRNSANEVLYFIVNLYPTGYLVVSGDDLIEPVIAVVPKGRYEPSRSNPLGAMLYSDMRERTQTCRSILFFDDSIDSPETKARSKWEFLKDVGTGNILFGLASISDVRRSPLIQSAWDQKNVDGTTTACYNYYTARRDPPGTGPVVLWDSGNSNNYYCGCVATAMAQVMRYHQFPTTGVGTGSFNITVDATAVSRNLRGGNGTGGAYDYTSMVLVPGTTTTQQQREAIGTLCYDAGLSVNMDYTSDGSSSDTLDSADAFKNTFLYSNAVKGYDFGIELGTNLVKMINPNLDSNRPVILGVDGPSGGHAIICDGYGYNSGTVYHHLNMGWSGDDNAWYNLPTIDSSTSFDTVYKCVYNIYTTGSGEIISGRITDSGGVAIQNAVVTATGSGGPFTGTSDINGVYFLDHVLSNNTYSISVSAPGYSFTTVNKTAGTSIDNSVTSGNIWEVDFTGTMVGNPPAKPSITSPTSGQTGVSRNPSLSSSAFSDPDAGDTHQKTDWEIHDAAVPGTATTVWSKSGDTVNLVSITVTAVNGNFANALAGNTSLDGSVSYWVRTRHHDNNAVPSAWSDLVSFTTAANGGQPNKPSITSPTDGETGLSSNLTVTASAFSDPDPGDTLGRSEWEIHDLVTLETTTCVFYKSNGTGTSLLVTSANGTFQNCLQGVANLGYYNNYWVRVRYYDNNGMASEWSDPVSFQTNTVGFSKPDQPVVNVPSSGQTGVDLNPTINTSPFSDPVSTHIRSCWEIFDDPACNSANRVWYKYNETVNLVSVVVNTTNGTFENSLSGVTKLAANKQYFIRVKYFNGTGGSSTWAPESAFTTLNTAMPPNKPAILNPTSGEINVALNPDITSSGFSDPDVGDTHFSSDWEVYNSSVISGANRVWFKTGETVNLTLINVNSANGTFENALSGSTALALNTQYWVRVRYTDSSSSSSEWSNTVGFTTVVFESTPPDKPVISVPANGASNVVTNPPITSSAFNDADPFDTHLRTDWEIYDQATLVSTSRVWYKTGDTVNLTATVGDSVNGEFANARLGMSDLANSTQYWVRVRYIDNSYTASEWSNVINFTTVASASAEPAKPSIVSPTSGQTGVKVNPDITASVFSDPDPTGTHQKSDWEVYTTPTPLSSSRVWYKFDDAVYLTSTRIDSAHGTFEKALSGASYLAYSTQYYVRVRYCDDTDVYSDWSNMIGFTTGTTLNNVPNAPAIVTPVNNATGVNPNANLVGSAFADPDPGDSHFESDWEVYDSPSLLSNNLVWSSMNNPLNLTTVTVNTASGTFSNSLAGQTSLIYMTDYYVRVRYQDNLGNLSNWSAVSKFTTGEQPNNPAQKPSITYPTDALVNVDINPALTSSAFSDPDAGDTHLRSDWEIYDNAMTAPANLVWSKLIDTVNLTSITVNSTNGTFSNALAGATALDYVVDYWVRVRYHDSRNMTTEWSDLVQFQTRSSSVNPPNKPQITYPTPDLSGVMRNFKSTASAFSDLDVADTHAKSDWRIFDNQSLETTAIVWEISGSTTELVAANVSQPGGTFKNALAGQLMLASNTQYWITVRYFDNNSVPSQWADAVHFTTGTSTIPAKPKIISPPPGQHGIDLNQTVISSAFSDLEPGDTHARSDWEVYDDAPAPFGFSGTEGIAGTRVWSKSDDSTNLTITMINSRYGAFENSHAGFTRLKYNTIYWFRVRYWDSSSTASEWSDMVMFRTGFVSNVIHTDEAYDPYDNDTSLLFTWEVAPGGIPNFDHFNIFATQDIVPFPPAPSATSTVLDHFTLEVGTGNTYGFLGHGHLYRLRIQSVSITGEVGMSIEARVAVDNDLTQILVDTVAPYQPVVIHTNEANPLYDDDKLVEFTWTPYPVNDDPLNGLWFSQYAVYQRTNNAGISFVKLQKGNIFSIENATNLYSYEVFVVPFDYAGNKGMTGSFGPVWVINEAPEAPDAPQHSDDAPAGFDDDYFLYFSWSKQLPKTIYQVNLFMNADGPILTAAAHRLMALSDLSSDPGFTLDVRPGVIGFDPQGKGFGVKTQFIAYSGITSKASFTSTPYPVKVVIGVPNQPNKPVLSEEVLNPPYVGARARFAWKRKADAYDLSAYNVSFQRSHSGSASPEVTFILSSLRPPGQWLSYEIDGLADSTIEPGVKKPLNEDDHIRCRVQSVNSVGKTSQFSQWSSDAIVDLFAPTKPVILEYLPNPVDADTISVTLTAPATDTHPPITYQIQGTAYSTWQDITGPPFIVTMKQNQGNFIRIRAVDAAGRISTADEIYVTESSLGPSQPGQPIHTDADAPSPWDNDQNLEFSWQPPASGVISQYRFYINIDGERGLSGETVWRLVGSTNSAFYTYGAPYGGEKHFYQAKVEAIDSLGRTTTGPSSSVVYVDVVAPRPDPLIDKTTLWFDGNTGIATAYGDSQVIRLSRVVLSDENGFIYQIRGGIYVDWTSARLDVNQQLVFKLVPDTLNVLEVRAADPARNYTAADKVSLVSIARKPPQPSEPLHSDADANPGYDNDTRLDFSWEDLGLSFKYLNSYIVYLSINEKAYQYYKEVFTNEVVVEAMEENVYRIKVRAKDIFSNLSEYSPASLPIIVDVSPAKILKSSLNDGDVFVATTTFVEITFDEPMDQSSLIKRGNVKLIDQDGYEIDGKIVYDNATNKLTFTPYEDLKHDYDYKFIISREVKDLAGNRFDDDIVIGFHTMPPDGFKIMRLLNYPNPVSNAGTTFSYYLSQDAYEVTLNIYSISGKKIRTLEGCPAFEGYNEIFWDGTDEWGSTLPNGTYMVMGTVYSNDLKNSTRIKFSVLK